MRLWGCVLVVLLQALVSLAQENPPATTQPTQLPVVIAPADARIYYIGRFDMMDPAGPRCQWSHSQARIRFHGTDLQAKVGIDEKAYLQVEVDGKPTVVLHSGKGTFLLDIARNLPAGDHEAAVFKRTEAHTGIVQFQGFYLNAGGELLQLRRMTRYIEVVGETIVNGYGNEGTGPAEHYLPEHQNAYMSFGAIAGRELDAEVSCISWGFLGRLVAEYDLVLPFVPETKWQFKRQPDVILNMAWTYAFQHGDTKEIDRFIMQFKAFTQDIRRHNPPAVIYVTTNPLITDLYPAGGEAFRKMREALQEMCGDLSAEGDGAIRYLEFATQDDRRDGFGGDYNPTVKTHIKMAKKLVETLGTDLNWKTEPAAKVGP